MAYKIYYRSVNCAQGLLLTGLKYIKREQLFDKPEDLFLSKIIGSIEKTIKKIKICSSKAWKVTVTGVQTNL